MFGKESTAIQELIQGDRKAYLGLFDDFFHALCLFTHRYIEDIPTCEDCVQDAFIALWEHRSDIKSMAHVKAFLYQVCRNNALNILKHERVKNEFYTQNREELESQVCFINYVIEEETERILATTEQQLPPKCREIFVLAMQGKSNEEIAISLGVSENTVKTQKKIAYKRLKEQIARMGMLLILLKI